MRRLLCSMIKNHQFGEFAVPQFKSLLRKSTVSLDTLLKQELVGKSYSDNNQINHLSFLNFPFVVMSVPDFSKHRQCNYRSIIDFEQVFRNSVLISKTILLIAEGKTYDDLIQGRNQQTINQYCMNPRSQYMIQFMARNRTVGKGYQLQKINTVIQGMGIKGHVSLKNPIHRYWLIENHQWYQGHHNSPRQSTIKHIYFGIQISNNHKNSKFNSQFQVNKRIYLSPTSIGNQLAFLMCHQALVQKDSLVIDPFVGSGGLLLAATSLGAITFGVDLDYRILNGTSVGRINVKSPYFKQDQHFQQYKPKINLNFQQYQMTTPNIIRADSTNLPFKQKEYFDCIVTDPPYGFRAASIKVSSKSVSPEVQQNSQKEDEIYQNKCETDQMTVAEEQNCSKVSNKIQFDKEILKVCQNKVIIENLLEFGRRNLKKEGRLVFLYPVLKDSVFQGVSSLPQWEGYRIIDVSQNKLQGVFSRILITLQKK